MKINPNATFARINHSTQVKRLKKAINTKMVSTITAIEKNMLKKPNM